MSQSPTTPKNGHLAAIRERVRLRRASEHHATRLQLARDYTLIFLGAALLAVSMDLFFIPNDLVAGGLSGTAQIINSFTGWPIGTVSFILNIPLFFLGWRFLGGRRFLARTVAASLIFSVILDGLQLFWPGVRLTDDLALNALYGGVTAGVAVGLLFRAPPAAAPTSWPASWNGASACPYRRPTSTPMASSSSWPG